MNAAIPAAEPIPLPAPVWLMKFLGDLTLTIHFIFLYLLIGGLVLSAVWNFIGRRFGDKEAVGASGVVMSRLPIVMTYVINFGVPPLLFVQVLYGQVIYTATILIGLWWMSVIFAIMGAYFAIYRCSYLASAGRGYWGWGVLALLFILYVGKVYSTAMALMLRPEDWAGMYARSDFGVYFPPADATRLPRYLYMMVLSVGYGGLLTSLYSAKGSLEEGVKRFLRVWGGRVGGVFLILGLFIGLWAWQQQPVEVRNGVWGVGIVPYAVVVWALGLLMGVVASIWISLTPASWGYGKAYLAGAASVMGAGGYVILRDMVRDVTLMLKGFDVWQRVVNPNWYVIGLFFVSLLVGVGLLVWLYFILRSARPSIEKYV